MPYGRVTPSQWHFKPYIGPDNIRFCLGCPYEDKKAIIIQDAANGLLGHETTTGERYNSKHHLRAMLIDTTVATTKSCPRNVHHILEGQKGAVSTTVFPCIVWWVFADDALKGLGIKSRGAFSHSRFNGSRRHQANDTICNSTPWAFTNSSYCIKRL